MRNLIIRWGITLIFFLVPILLYVSCTSYYDERDHGVFYSVFDQVKEEYPNIILTEKYYEGYGQYFIKVSSGTTNIDDAVIVEILHELDDVINGTPECMSLLNGCYISVKTDSNKWISIRYHHDVETVLKTNLDQTSISKIQLLFPDINIMLFEMIDGKYIQVDF